MSLPFGLDLNNSISQDRLSTKITASLRELGSLEYKDFAIRVDKYIANNMPKNMVSEGTGQRAIFVYMGEVILENLSYALSVGLVLITLTIILFFRSLRLGMLTTIPNILPIGVAFGIWGLLVSEVSFLTALGMGTTLGIVVDFTVHLLSKYLHARNTLSLDKEEAIIYAFETVGFPLIIMTFILICGFMVLLSAYFVPMHGFALFSSLAFFVALILDLFYFPALLLKFDKN
jgi:predicted RND superfamily exporter protein